MNGSKLLEKKKEEALLFTKNKKKIASTEVQQ